MDLMMLSMLFSLIHTFTYQEPAFYLHTYGIFFLTLHFYFDSKKKAVEKILEEEVNDEQTLALTGTW
jgi:hypothetical protein